MRNCLEAGGKPLPHVDVSLSRRVALHKQINKQYINFWDKLECGVVLLMPSTSAAFLILSCWDPRLLFLVFFYFFAFFVGLTLALITVIIIIKRAYNNNHFVTSERFTPQLKSTLHLLTNIIQQCIFYRLYIFFYFSYTKLLYLWRYSYLWQYC